MCESALLASMCVCQLLVCLVLMEARIRQGIRAPGTIWMLGTEPRSSGGTVSAFKN